MAPKLLTPKPSREQRVACIINIMRGDTRSAAQSRAMSSIPTAPVLASAIDDADVYTLDTVEHSAVAPRLSIVSSASNNVRSGPLCVYGPGDSPASFGSVGALSTATGRLVLSQTLEADPVYTASAGMVSRLKYFKGAYGGGVGWWYTRVP
jgi:hypothetical protein